MRTRLAGLLAATSTATVLALTVAAVPSATAAPGSGWQVGDCFASADVHKDVVNLSSKADCAKPHAVQVIGGAALPASLTKYSLPQLLDQKNAKVRAELVTFSEQTCSGTNIAPGIWPKQGDAIAKSLKGMAATGGGGVLPSLPGTINYAWAFPDAKSYSTGDKSLLCVVFPMGENGASLTGNAQLVGTSRTLPQLRTCYDNQPASDASPLVSCARPHGDEQLLYVMGKLPVAYGEMSDAQWAPFDAQCEALMDILVGANRADLKAFADTSPESAVNAPVYLGCYARRAPLADGSKPSLPGGTVVGLGKKPLKSA